MAYRHIVRNPRLQARIFLPEWFMRVVKPTKELPENVVKFHIPMQMSRLDVKNYLQKIYQISVANVNIKIQECSKTERVMMKTGEVKTKRSPDIKMAYVTLTESTFRFPELFLKSEEAPDTESEAKMKKPEEFKWF